MRKNAIVIAAVLLLLHGFILPARSFAAPAAESKRVLKIRSRIQALGAGEQARLEVKLKDGAKLKGYINEARDDCFVMTEDVSNRSVTVPYPQVQQAKGHNLTTGTKILIAVGVLVVVAILIGVELGKA